MERTHVGAAHEGLNPEGGPHTGTREKCEDERVEEVKCYELTTTLIFHPCALLGAGRGGRRVRSEVKPGKKGGWREGGLVLVLSFSLLSFFNWQ